MLAGSYLSITLFRRYRFGRLGRPLLLANATAGFVAGIPDPVVYQASVTSGGARHADASATPAQLNDAADQILGLTNAAEDAVQSNTIGDTGTLTCIDASKVGCSPPGHLERRQRKAARPSAEDDGSPSTRRTSAILRRCVA